MGKGGGRGQNDTWPQLVSFFMPHYHKFGGRGVFVSFTSQEVLVYACNISGTVNSFSNHQRKNTKFATSPGT